MIRQETTAIRRAVRALLAARRLHILPALKRREEMLQETSGLALLTESEY